jgi:hypothetical protein
MNSYRKKPVVIEALQLRADTIKECLQFVGADNILGGGHEYLEIMTLEGPIRARLGDWIICGVKGEFYPCKPDIFEATYEPAEMAEHECQGCGIAVYLRTEEHCWPEDPRLQLCHSCLVHALAPALEIIHRLENPRKEEA